MDDRNRLAVGSFVAFFTGFIVVHLVAAASYETFTFAVFIDPGSVADIAAQMPQGEDEFILASWNYVGSGIKYSNYGSLIKITSSAVECNRCLLATEVLKARLGNCVGKAILLTSILRNRIPPERIYMALGQYFRNYPSSDSEGHAWVDILRGNTWDLMESTLPPPANPWKPAEEMPQYVPEAFLNDQSRVCLSEELCVRVKEAECDCHRGQLLPLTV